MAREPLVAIADILREIDALEYATSRAGFDGFQNDIVTYRSVAFSLLIVSEAVRHLPSAWLDDFPQIPWRDVRGIGNRLRHDYFKLSNEVLWKTATVDALELKDVIKQMRERHYPE